VSRGLTDDEMTALLRDCTHASIALADWFASQSISPTKAVIVVGIMLTGLADAGKLTDKKIDKALHHIRVLTRAYFAENKRRKRKHAR
jgi:hypothetical protein